MKYTTEVTNQIHKILDYMWHDEKNHFNGEEDHMFYVLIKLVLAYKVEALYVDILRTLSNILDDRKLDLSQDDRKKLVDNIKLIKNTDLFYENDDDTLVCSNCISPGVYIQQFINPNDGSTYIDNDYEMIAICEYCNFEETELVPLSKAEK
tara:strand:- start:8239 stop:8691 length:453 start_codon:yes stop_codon:yes gene_type:complete